MDPVWVFGYGSLIWNPGFDVAERAIARLGGFARSFCMWSIHHRGTVDDPGLVLALDRDDGAACMGMAFRMGGDVAGGLAELRERELVSSAYREERHILSLSDGRQVEALTYVVDRDHAQYCGALTLERQAQIIARARGGRGANHEYLTNTARHLDELGLPDPDLTWLSARVRDITGV
ncbi:gamma-glutamylcyclotransferase [Aliiroseovarius sp. PTFE2010]|uniref:gamma-glutamylcyclotransferase n=1 Tax=Aliiroseovarius sp. PTFE2010 TaxID=3417190 RepID=UPI003CE6F984